MKNRSGSLALVCVVAGVVVSTSPGWARKQGGTLRIQHMDTPPSASIHEEATVSVAVPFMSIYNNLAIVDRNVPTNALDTIIPDLATSRETKDGGQTLVFKTRDSVKWHDGRPFAAATSPAPSTCCSAPTSCGAIRSAPVPSDSPTSR